MNESWYTVHMEDRALLGPTTAVNDRSAMNRRSLVNQAG